MTCIQLVGTRGSLISTRKGKRRVASTGVKDSKSRLENVQAQLQRLLGRASWHLVSQGPGILNIPQSSPTQQRMVLPQISTAAHKMPGTQPCYCDNQEHLPLSKDPKGKGLLCPAETTPEPQSTVQCLNSEAYPIPWGAFETSRRPGTTPEIQIQIVCYRTRTF